MCKFIQIDSLYKISPNYLEYISLFENCYHKYFKYIQDDFSQYKNICELVKYVNPYLWLILDYEKNFKGFVFLDNFVGNKNYTYSAELTTCFEKSAWGNYTGYCAKVFLKKCFDKLGLQKIKAQVYTDNFRVKTLLKNSGFTYESTLKNETMRHGKLQDIEVYGLYKSYYYKNEEKIYE